MKLVIINYGSGNLHSVHKAFEAVNNNLENPYEIIVTNTPSEILNANKLVLPGVGAFQDCKNAIHKIDGLFESLEQVVIGEKKAFMGICVGMQLLAEKSLEFGECEGFGWIPGEVIKIEAPADYKIPHMGWNEVTFRNHELLNNISQNTDFYFVHSYYVRAEQRELVAATTTYGLEFDAVLARDNVFAAQFHPEKSSNAGLQLPANFMSWDGQA